MTSGINHFKNLGMMGGYAKSKGVPAARLVVPGTGVILILGGLSVILGLLLLVLFLVPTSVLMHDYWTVEDPHARAAEQVNFMKNLALMYGAADWPYALV